METELKLDLAPGAAEALVRAAPLAAAGPGEERRLHARYHDTARHTLRRADLTLRVRTDGTRHVQTVKADGQAAGLFARPEWEFDVPDDAPVIDAAAGPLAAALAGETTAVVFETIVQRRQWLVTWQDATIEVALDHGEVRAGERAAPLSELELELRDGPVAALFDLARTLDQAAPLRPGVRAKSERGYRLAEGAAAEAVKAEPIALDPDDMTADAFATIARACLRQYRLNEALLLDGDAAPLPLHQARVALRRLRAAIALFKPLFAGDAKAGVLAAELRAVAAVLGTVRDLDVLAASHAGSARERIVEARERAFAAARERLEEPATRRLMLDLVEWLAIGDWRIAPADPTLANGPIAPFASELLRRRRRRLKRQGADLVALDDHGRHQLRIAGKKLRYAAEFFAELWPGGKARRRHKAFLHAIAAVQDALGALNDAVTAGVILHQLGIEAEPALDDRERRHAVKRASHAFDTLVEVKRFW